MIKAQKFSDSKQAERHFRRHLGIQSLGWGNFSVVYVSDDASKDEAEYVLKVFDPGNDSGIDVWPKFAEYAKRMHAQNSLFPKVVLVEVFPDGSYVGVIEKVITDRARLNEACREAMSGTMVRHALGRPEAQPTPSPLRAKGTTTRHFDNFGLALDRVMRSQRAKMNPMFNHAQYDVLEDAVRECLENFDVTWEAAEEFCSITRKFGRWDLHGGNAGFRADGSVCFFDPVA